jgi:monodictyphenone polyketide synthase
MNLADLAVTKGLVANRNTDTPQIIRVTIATEDLASRTATLVWQTIENKSFASNTFATAKIIYGETTEWSKSWIPMAHLIQGRIHALDQLAIAGKANRFTRSMAYNLFAKNLVDYSEKYRGMQSVTMHELEAFADVQLAKETGLGGTWTIPPYFIDSVAHLAGFVMNCSDSNDTTRNYYVTPGWQSMRFAKSLQPAAHYRSYVKMIPTAEDPGVYLGDVYILQDDVIIGMVGAIQFRQFPRILLGRFFSPPDRPDTTAPSGKNDISGLRNSKLPGKEAITATLELPTYTKATVHSPESTPSARTLDGNHVDTSVDIIGKISATQISIVGKPRGMEDHSDSVASVAIRLIAEEAGLGLEDLDDDAGFEALGIDSLMSLVISERLRKELNVKVGGSIFLDYPTIGDLRMWLKEAYS